jgi:hypothetical protein
VCACVSVLVCVYVRACACAHLSSYFLCARALAPESLFEGQTFPWT